MKKNRVYTCLLYTSQRIKAFVVGKHRGELGKSYSLAFSDNRNVLIKALKKAESSDEYVVRAVSYTHLACTASSFNWWVE